MFQLLTLWRWWTCWLLPAQLCRFTAGNWSHYFSCERFWKPKGYFHENLILSRGTWHILPFSCPGFSEQGVGVLLLFPIVPLSDCSCSSAPQVCHWFNVRMAVLWTTNPMQSMCPSVLGQDIEPQVAPTGKATGLWMHVCQWSLFPISRWQVEVDVLTSSSVWITDYVCTHTIFPIRFLYSQQQLGYSVRM